MELFLMKKVRPERNTDRAIAVEQPASTHRAAQLVENHRRERLICCEQVVVFSNRPFPQGMLGCGACVQELSK